MDTWLCLLLLISLSDQQQQATEPYNNEESASRDEGGSTDAQISPDNSIVNMDNMDNMDNIDAMDNMDNSSKIDDWTGGIDAGENMRKRKNDSESQATVIISNTKANEMERARDREKEGEEVNIKEEVKATTVSTAGLVEVERLRTQVAVVAGFGGALLILLSAAVLVLGCRSFIETLSLTLWTLWSPSPPW